LTVLRELQIEVVIAISHRNKVDEDAHCTGTIAAAIPSPVDRRLCALVVN